MLILLPALGLLLLVAIAEGVIWSWIRGWSADGPGTTTRELRTRQSAAGKPAQPPAEIARPVAHECGDAGTTAFPLAAASGR